MVAKITKKEERAILEGRIKKGIGAWKISRYKQRKTNRIGFHNRKGRFITSIQSTPESKRLMRVHAKRVVIEGRVKGFRATQLFQINFYSQTQANDLGKRVRKGLVPIKKDRRKRDIDLFFDKYKYEFMSRIKYTS